MKKDERVLILKGILSVLTKYDAVEDLELDKALDSIYSDVERLLEDMSEDYED